MSRQIRKLLKFIFGMFILLQLFFTLHHLPASAVAALSQPPKSIQIASTYPLQDSFNNPFPSPEGYTWAG